MNFRRLLLFVACAVWMRSPAQAQISEQRITLDLTVNPLLPQYIHDWGLSDGNAVLTISNETQDVINAKVDVQVRIGDTLYARARLFNMPLLQVVPGITTYTSGQLFPTVELELYRDTEQQRSAPNATLPPGSYMLCLQLIEEDGSKPLSLPICRPFTIEGAVRPTLLYPSRIVDLAGAPNETMQFRWELPYAVAPAPVQWVLRVVEANTAGSDSTAILTGTVVLERIIRDSTSFILATPSALFAADQRYLWSVRPMGGARSTTESSTPSRAISTDWAVPLPFTIIRPAIQQQRR